MASFAFPLAALVIGFLFSLFVLGGADNWPCSRTIVVAACKQRQLLNPFSPFAKDPYHNQTKQSLQQIDETLKNEVVVCAMAYKDSQRKAYTLKEFPSKEKAEEANYTVTHQGRCGACSSLQDLAVYLEKNLTVPVRKCGMKSIISNKWALNCIKDLAFSDNCAQIWLYNTLNTRKHCFWVCMSALITNKPFNKPDGSLNDCLQCDEDKSGPIFKYFSGRTRRNSGIISAIDRPNSEVYKMNHCYVL